MQTRTKTFRERWNKLFSNPISSNHYQTQFSDAKDEGFHFRVYGGDEEYPPCPAENVEIFADKLEFRLEGAPVIINYSQLKEVLTLLKSKTITLFLIEKSTWSDWVLFVGPPLIAIFIFVFSSQLADLVAQDPLWAVIVLGFVLTGLSYILIIVSARNTVRKQQKSRLRAFSADRPQTVIQKLDKAAAEDDEKKYFSTLITGNVEYIGRYYALIEEQANKSFRLTRNVAVAGFVLLSVGIIVSFFQGLDKPASVLTVTSGLLIEFISAVFFYLYNRTITELDTYHDKLIQVQNTMLALKIAQGIEKNDKLKNETLQSVTNSLMEYVKESVKSKSLPAAESIQKDK